jgi:hypothetical protein
MALTKPVKLGMSAAASWAWGTSLIVGMEIAQQKGLMAWSIWAVANVLTLVLFGELARRGVLGRKVFDIPLIKTAAILIQAFCLVIQLNIINKVLLSLGAAPWLGYSLATLTGIIFTLLMYKKGLRTSILTDRFQWLIAMAAILVIIGIGLATGAERFIYPTSTSSNIGWGVWSACILLAGPIGDVQHWQRGEVAGRTYSYHWGALFFAVYMLLILAMSYFKFNAAMNIILLIAVLCVTSSTIDSIAVAMHEVSNKRMGTLIALYICVFWGMFAKMGIIELWSKAGVFRVAFACVVLAIAYCVGKDAADREELINEVE